MQTNRSIKKQDPVKIQDELRNLLNKYIPLNPELSQALDLSKPQYPQFVLNWIASKFTIKDIQFFCTVIADHSKLSEKEAYDKKRDAFFDRFWIQEMAYCPHPDTIDKIENFILNTK